jgi:hypothetical protein
LSPSQTKKLKVANKIRKKRLRAFRPFRLALYPIHGQLHGQFERLAERLFNEEQIDRYGVQNASR